MEVQLKASQGFGGPVCSGYLSLTFPIMFVLGRAPQKRLSFASSALSPRTKYAPSGTV